MQRKIIGLGETVFDIIFRDDQPSAAVPGGSTFNALISLGRTAGVQWSDMEIQMVTEVGDDHIGDIFVRFMERNHVSTASVTRNPGTKSHISLAFLDHNNDAQYEFYKDHKHVSLQADKATVRGGFAPDDLVLFGSFFAINPVLRSYTAQFISNAHDAGAILYYDINFRSSHIPDIPDTLANIEQNCRWSTIVRGSAEDFGYLYGTTDPQQIYSEHIAPLCPYFICTDGPRPVWIFTPSGTIQVPVAPIQAVSTIGAGDNFNAGFLYGLISQGIGRDALLSLPLPQWQQLVCQAQQFSAQVCQSLDNYVPEGWKVTAGAVRKR